MVVFAMSQEAARPWKLRRVDAVAVSQEAARHVPGGGSTAVADTVSDSVAAPWRDAAAAAAAARAHAVDNAPKSEDIEAVMKPDLTQWSQGGVGQWFHLKSMLVIYLEELSLSLSTGFRCARCERDHFERHTVSWCAGCQAYFCQARCTRFCRQCSMTMCLDCPCWCDEGSESDRLMDVEDSYLI